MPESRVDPLHIWQLLGMLNPGDIQAAIVDMEKKLATLRVMRQALLAPQDVLVTDSQPAASLTHGKLPNGHVTPQESQNADDLPVSAKDEAIVSRDSEPSNDPPPAAMRLTKSGKVDKRCYAYKRRLQLQAEEAALLTPPQDFKAAGAHQTIPDEPPEPAIATRNGHTPDRPGDSNQLAKAVADKATAVADHQAATLGDRIALEIRTYGKMNTEQLSRRLRVTFGEVHATLQAGPFKRNADMLWENAESK